MTPPAVATMLQDARDYNLRDHIYSLRQEALAKFPPQNRNLHRRMTQLTAPLKAGLNDCDLCPREDCDGVLFDVESELVFNGEISSLVRCDLCGEVHLRPNYETQEKLAEVIPLPLRSRAWRMVRQLATLSFLW